MLVTDFPFSTPLCVMAIGTFELLPIHTRHFSPRPLELRIGAPIPTAGLSTRQSEPLTVQLRQAIDDLRIAPTAGNDQIR